MSLTLTICPLVIAVSASVSGSAVGLLSQRIGGQEADLPPIQTCFADADLLVKTLREHGLTVRSLSETEFTVETEAGILHYFRRPDSETFWMDASGVRDIQALLDSLDSLENEYGRNVQKFTYDRVLRGLTEHGMAVGREEILEDDSILLTLTLDE